MFSMQKETKIRVIFCCGLLLLVQRKCTAKVPPKTMFLIHHHHPHYQNSWMACMTLSLSLSLSLSRHLSLFFGSQCLHKSDGCKILFLSQHWCVHLEKSIHKGCLWIRPYFTSCTQHVLLAFLGWFARWDVNGHSAAVLEGAVSWICSKQHAESMCNFHNAFSPGVLLKSKGCNHTIVLTWL